MQAITMKNILSRPRVVLWICRLVPLPIWTFMIVAAIAEAMGQSVWIESPVISGVFSLSVCPYLMLIFYLLPVLLYEGDFRPRRDSGYYWFMFLTGGLGPLVWYYMRVDPVLRKMASKSKQK